MGETNMIRPISTDEKVQGEIVEVGQTNLLDLFLANLAKKATEYQKEYKPFDAYSARIDFDEKVRRTIGDINLAVDKSKVNKKIDIGNLDKYGKADKFEFLESSDVREDKLLDGIRNTIVTGKTFKFRSKERGNGITIFVPNSAVSEVESYVAKTYESKSAKDKTN